MAISPPSDIILDVARAADPLQYRAAVEKLTRIANGAMSAVSANGFEEALGLTDSAAAGAGTVGVETVGAETVEAAATNVGADLRGRFASQASGADGSPYRQFEAFVLQSFVQSILPKEAEHVFGDGLAGGFWKSMLAEQIAKQLADAGGVGIADAIAPAQSARAASSASAFNALPGYVSSLERGFADSIFPGSGEDAGSPSPIASADKEQS